MLLTLKERKKSFLSRHRGPFLACVPLRSPTHDNCPYPNTSCTTCRLHVALFRVLFPADLRFVVVTAHELCEVSTDFLVFYHGMSRMETKRFRALNEGDTTLKYGSTFKKIKRHRTILLSPSDHLTMQFENTPLPLLAASSSVYTKMLVRCRMQHSLPMTFRLAVFACKRLLIYNVAHNLEAMSSSQKLRPQSSAALSGRRC